MKAYIIDAELMQPIIEASVIRLNGSTMIADVLDTEIDDLEHWEPEDGSILISMGDYKGMSECTFGGYSPKNNMMLVNFRGPSFKNSREYHIGAINRPVKMINVPYEREFEAILVKAGFSGIRFSTNEILKDGDKVVLNISRGAVNTSLLCEVQFKFDNKSQNKNDVYQASFLDLGNRPEYQAVLYDFLIDHIGR